MILKGKQSEDLQKLDQPELIERYLNDIFKNCRHSVTFEQADPDGNLPKEMCKLCGEEVFK
jgi:hypothetical protein